jgi:transcriptional regulator with XRE-family HTH domain
MGEQKNGRAPSAVDLRIGERVRARRFEIGMSQEVLGDRLGITFQQVQKYEKGANRISASRLLDIATVLEMPVADFFEGLVSSKAKTARRRRG